MCDTFRFKFRQAFAILTPGAPYQPKILGSRRRKQHPATDSIILNSIKISPQIRICQATEFFDFEKCNQVGTGLNETP
jgi:hypothetical protein